MYDSIALERFTVYATLVAIDVDVRVFAVIVGEPLASKRGEKKLGSMLPSEGHGMF